VFWNHSNANNVVISKGVSARQRGDAMFHVSNVPGFGAFRRISGYPSFGRLREMTSLMKQMKHETRGSLPFGDPTVARVGVESRTRIIKCPACASCFKRFTL